MKRVSPIALAMAIAMSGCSPAPTTPVSEPTTSNADKVSPSEQLDNVVTQNTQVFMAQQPALSTMLAIAPEQVGGEYNQRFPNYSSAGMAELQSAMRNASQTLASVSSNDLAPSEQLHQAVVGNIFDYYAGFADFSGGYIDTWGGHLPYVINQISGPLVDIPKLMQVQQSVTNEAEAKAYLERLAHFDSFVDEVLGKFEDDKKNGIRLPANLHPKTLAYFDSFLSSAPSAHALVTTFEDKLATTDLSQDTQAELVNNAIETVTLVVYPAYEKARGAILASQQDAPTGDGIWVQPGGDAFYRHAIRYLGDSPMTADEIHQVGLDEVARIAAEMDKILADNGYRDGSVGERMVALAKRPEMLYEDSDAGRQQLLDDLNVEIDAIMEKAPSYYQTFPQQAVEVRRIPPVSEAGEAGGFYTPPSLDGTRPGIYWINLRDMAAVPKFGLKTLTYHEAVPGHHFQIALNMAQQDIGLLRQNAPYNAYVEGWALYSELVAKQIGMYSTDPFGDLGRLQAELYRAVRLVVDTGLHRKKWTREQAIEYFHTTTGTSMTDVIAEVERYMAWPGQALGYKLGMLQFVELRQQAEAQLGDAFDVKAFHDLILLPGARPMSIVREDVNHWIAKVKAS